MKIIVSCSLTVNRKKHKSTIHGEQSSDRTDTYSSCLHNSRLDLLEMCIVNLQTQYWNIDFQANSQDARHTLTKEKE